MTKKYVRRPSKKDAVLTLFFLIVFAVMRRLTVAIGRYRDLRQIAKAIVVVVILAGANVALDGLVVVHTFTSKPIMPTQRTNYTKITARER